MTAEETKLDDLAQWISLSLAEKLAKKLTTSESELLVANFKEIANRAVSSICARILRENPNATKSEMREILLTFSRVK